MSITPLRYMHVPLYVEAIQVTPENIDAVAEWCGGTVKTTKDGVPYIRVDAHRPEKVRNTMAYHKDWVVKIAVGWKVYNPRAFSRGFVPAPDVELTPHQREAFETLTHKPNIVTLNHSSRRTPHGHAK